MHEIGDQQNLRFATVKNFTDRNLRTKEKFIIICYLVSVTERTFPVDINNIKPLSILRKAFIKDLILAILLADKSKYCKEKLTDAVIKDVQEAPEKEEDKNIGIIISIQLF
nr:6915_t:CDS:2 [Entrophospora candida]